MYSPRENWDPKTKRTGTYESAGLKRGSLNVGNRPNTVLESTVWEK